MDIRRDPRVPFCTGAGSRPAPRLCDNPPPKREVPHVCDLADLVIRSLTMEPRVQFHPRVQELSYMCQTH